MMEQPQTMATMDADILPTYQPPYGDHNSSFEHPSGEINALGTKFYTGDRSVQWDEAFRRTTDRRIVGGWNFKLAQQNLKVA